MNTRIRYQYRSHIGIERIASVVIEGELTLGEIDRYLDCDVYFIPSQVGLKMLQPLIGRVMEEGDHPWHEIVSVLPTGDEPTVNCNAIALLVRFQEVVWYEEAACDMLDIPYPWGELEAV